MEQSEYPPQVGKLILIVSLVAAPAFLVPTTLAYMFDHAGSLINTFAPKTDVLTEAPVEIVIEKTVLSSTDKKMGPEGFTFQLEDVTTAKSRPSPRTRTARPASC